MKITQTLQNLPSITMRQILENSVKSRVGEYWDRKITEGIIPTEVKQQGFVDMGKHNQEMEALTGFEVYTVSRLFRCLWGSQSDEEIKELHYFGIGEGKALEDIVPIANFFGHRVVAYDVSSVACDNGVRAFMKETIPGSIHSADIEIACGTRFIPKTGSIKIIASRVLGVLDKQEKNWEKKHSSKRKMARTARKIGKLVSSSAECLLIHACPEDNPNAVWGDTTSHSLEEILGYMQEGSGEVIRLRMTRYGSVRFHSHIYTAVLVHRAVVQRKD